MKKTAALALAILFFALCFSGCAAFGKGSETTAAPAEETTPEATQATAPETTPGTAENKEIVLTKDNFDEMIAGDTPILVDFWASWCGPCMKLAPLLEQLANESDGSYRVGKVNVDEQSELSERFEVSAIPLLRSSL